MQSMTGFGQGRVEGQGMACRVEISSVNRRQLDISMQLPRQLSMLEPDLRAMVAGRIHRGRVGIKVQFWSNGEATSAVRLRVNRSLARAYLAVWRSLAEEVGVESRPDPSLILRSPGVVELEEEEIETSRVRPVVEAALAEALEELMRMRSHEGEHLVEALRECLSAITVRMERVKEAAPQVLEHHRAALQRRLKEAHAGFAPDDERVLREIALFADRCDISEELARLSSHVKKFESALEEDGAGGRALDFLAQEMSREWNTIGSKANDANLSQLVVEAKAETEKIREQVQNLE
ncbi:MAG TPA: YicC/YloC family endoribonuclease [Verrucomicrobiales bacterium]|nr:YicC/YloC family endoribonuclease [Verrucomicrobiales bacterium]